MNWQKERGEYTKARWLAPVVNSETVEIYFRIQIFQFRFLTIHFLFLEFDERDGLAAALFGLEGMSFHQRMRGQKL